MGPKIPKHLVEQYAAAFKEHERLKSVSGIVHGVRFFFLTFTPRMFDPTYIVLEFPNKKSTDR